MEGEPEAWAKAREAMAQVGSGQQPYPLFDVYGSPAGMYGAYPGYGVQS